MRDDQTGTFWQQISGRAISGPLAGYQLAPIYSDELTFALWRSEGSDGTILKPVGRYAKEYETKDWDVRMAKVKTVLDFPNAGLSSRDLVLGVNAFGASRAYPVSRILSEKLIEDRLRAEPVIVVLGPDNKSVRVFKARLHRDEIATEFYRNPGTPALTGALFMDAGTGSEWNFSGCAVSGKSKGSCLTPVPSIKDYWFDWRNYHPDTTIFRR